ncbi:MAG TPA: PDZ domain-containing protein [Pirellulaceae bacterium]|nr:PDZ domain-containing protein [Pirellulaceae bacterium]
MLARYGFAAFAAVSYVSLAGSTAFAQEVAESADPVAQEVVQLQLATEPGLSNPILLFGLQAAEEGDAAKQGDAAVGEAVANEATDAQEPPALWLGVQLANEVPPALAHHLRDAKGALVETVYPDSPAAESGIEAYDLIVRVGESDVDSPAKLVEAMKEVEAGPIDVVVLRGGERKTISVTPRERAAAQPKSTATTEATDLLHYAVPHMRVLPALGGPDAGAMHDRLVQSLSSTANLPENVESMKIHVERDGEKVVHRVEVTMTDGRIFKAANAAEMKAFPAEIRAALSVSQVPAPFTLRSHAVTGALAPQQRVIIEGPPTGPPTLVPAPAPVAAAPWVDVVTQHVPAAGGDVTYRVERVHPPGEEMNVLKKELSELRASVERIEELLREKE